MLVYFVFVPNDWSAERNKMLERGAVCKKTAGARSGGDGWSAGAAIKNRLERGAEGGAEVKKGRSAGALIPLDAPQRGRKVKIIPVPVYIF